MPAGTENRQTRVGCAVFVGSTLLLANAWVGGAAGVGIGIIIGAVLFSLITGNTIARAKRDAEQIITTAKTEAEAEKRSLELEAEKQAAKRRSDLDAEIAEARAEIRETQNRLTKREDTLDNKLEKITDREARLDDRDTKSAEILQRNEQRAQEIDNKIEELTERLEKVGNLSQDEARSQILQKVREDTEHEAHVIEQEMILEAENNARSRSREIVTMAIQRFAAEHVAESTVRSVRIPSDDMKGRIIGREGRNIRALERATGADILVDDTPGVIAVSCFDPIRRAIAGEALSKLVSDGRVHPSRIEEMIETIRTDMNERIIKYGNDAVMEANLRNVHPKVTEAMGKLHFRTSYGQNVLRHSMEVAYLSQMIAEQLGLNGNLARRCGFLHDIGKAMDHEMEGGHPAIGMEFARKYGEKKEAVLNAIGGHHGDIPATTPYTPIVMAADALSGARPGARRESMELYIKRLEQLEGIATEQSGVREAHAIQAGREVRVIIDAKKVDDAEAFAIARRIAKRVEDEMTFPGEIKVTVLREVRAEAVAR